MEKTHADSGLKFKESFHIFLCNKLGKKVGSFNYPCWVESMIQELDSDLGMSLFLDSRDCCIDCQTDIIRSSLGRVLPWVGEADVISVHHLQPFFLICLGWV